MKIGEFAKICETKISVLRHYDSEGLIKPIYMDRFTGYRYYAEEQVPLFFRISELKQAGFSLAEIKALLACMEDSEKAEQIFEKKKAELQKSLKNLKKIQKTMKGEFLMKPCYTPVKENINLPFVNDEAVVGRWRIINDGEFAKTGIRELYFLPRGAKYWCFSWTNGKLFYDNGMNSFVNDYTLEERKDGLYMYLDMKTGDFVENGTIKRLLLRKLDGKHYTKEEIARKDNMDYPFVNDPCVIGKWRSVAYLLHKEEFAPDGSAEPEKDLFFKEMEFFENGHINAVYGKELIGGDEKQVWTKGFVLRKFNSTACAYEIRRACGRDYLIIEWKSGDYRWGGFDTDYYVFVRA